MVVTRSTRGAVFDSSTTRLWGPASWTEARSTGKLALVCGFVLVCSLVLGGGARIGYLSDAILQVIAAPLLLMAIWRLPSSEAAGRARYELLFCTALVLVPILQLIPLPPEMWTTFPGREVIAEAFTLAGRELPWWPLSVAPHATWLGLVSLVVPISVFLATIQLRHRERRVLSLAVLAVGVASVFLGLLQVAQGPGSSLRFFAFTNPTEAVGFFANRNHFAALLYSLTLFAAAWTVHAGAQLTTSGVRKGQDTPLLLALFAALTVVVILIAAQMMARSRAGLLLTIATLLGIWALAVRHGKVRSGLNATRLLAGAVGLALVLGVQFALYRLLDRFDADPLADARIPFALNTIEAARAFMPFGSGVGTFVPVYQMFEKLEHAQHPFANRAHNDFLEVWLEAGVFALALMGAFVIWLVRRSIALWRAEACPGGEIDLLLARASGFALTLLSIHSLVDYPLRTASLMALLAFAAALMVEPSDAPVPVRSIRRRARPKKFSGEAPLAWPAPTPLDPAVPRRPPVQDWSDMEWPEAWRHPSSRSDRE